MLTKNRKIEKVQGKVFLVGAGPGDPGLVTVKALECLRQADLIVYDYLASPQLLRLADPKTKTVYVGKRGATHASEQEEINALLIREAQKGRRVVRFKGGDPFVFGRGGEEAEALAAAGVDFEVVPGVTSAIAVPDYAGIPVTHRDFTSTVAFVTGHEKDEEGAFPPDWAALSKIGTIVFLMGFGTLKKITQSLIAAGRNLETPVAVIEWGTLPRQKTVTGTLKTIMDEVGKGGIRPPTITVVGEVVNLRNKISWFEKRPLFGKRILVTRSRSQASQLTALLEEQGAEVFEVPTLELRPPVSWSRFDRLIAGVECYQWIVFSSVSGVEFFFERLLKKKKDIRCLKGTHLAAVGPETKRVLEARGLVVDLVASEFKAEGLIQKMSRLRLSGKKILVPQAQQARDVLVSGLEKLNAKVDAIDVYRSVVPKENIKDLQKLIEDKRVDLVTFASSQTVENFITMLGKDFLLAQAQKIPAACIGPITASTARQHGFAVVVQPKKYTIDNLVAAISKAF